MDRKYTAFQAGESSHCTIGAVQVATEGLGNVNIDLKDRANKLALAVLGANVATDGEIPRWNDNDKRTEDEVHEALRQASKTIANFGVATA